MRQNLSSPTPLKSERRNRASRRFLGALVVLVALYVGLGLLSHIPKMTFSGVTVTGTKVIDGDDVSQKTLEYLKGNVALVYARGNVFIYSQKKLTEFIKREFPRVYEVQNINRDGRTLNISLEERQAAFTWCGHEAPIYEMRFEKRECYFLDQTGFIFDASPFFTPGVYLAFYGGINPELPLVGQTINTTNSIIDFGELATSLEKQNLPVHSVVIHADGQNEFLLDTFTATGNFARILFNEDVSLGEILTKINSSVNEESFMDEFKDNGEYLEYIDTRFDNRVFYKFKQI